MSLVVNVRKLYLYIVTLLSLLNITIFFIAVIYILMNGGRYVDLEGEYLYYFAASQIVIFCSTLSLYMIDFDLVVTCDGIQDNIHNIYLLRKAAQNNGMVRFIKWGDIKKIHTPLAYPFYVIESIHSASIIIPKRGFIKNIKPIITYMLDLEDKHKYKNQLISLLSGLK